MDDSALKQYEAGGETLATAIAGLRQADLMAAPVPGKWSTHQVVVHLADCEIAFADRIQRVLAQDDPKLLAWDENKFAARLHYEEQSTEDAMDLVRLLRHRTGRLLRLVSPAELERAGTHDERGRQTVLDIVGYANRHLEHHLKFIHEKRERLGKPARGS
jgi:uncharacterized damage-inducible protein DinB